MLSIRRVALNCHTLKQLLGLGKLYVLLNTVQNTYLHVLKDLL